MSAEAPGRAATSRLDAPSLPSSHDSGPGPARDADADADPLEPAQSHPPASAALGLASLPRPLSSPPPPLSPPSSSPRPGPSTTSATSAAPTSHAHRRQPRPDPLSDKATAALIRRVLCPQRQKSGTNERPIEELLPPLTSRNDLDLQLYALIAILVREYVQSWYSTITTDETFVEEVVQIIAHCTRALEQRLRKVDLESLLFDELPDLIDRHVSAYRASRKPLASFPIVVDPRQVYHSLCPVPQLSPVPMPEHDPQTVRDQEANERAYRQLLAEGVLAVLLPTEDLQNPCFTTLVVQILSELVIGNVVANKLAQPWMVYELLCITSKSVVGSGAGSNGGGGGQRRGEDTGGETPSSTMPRNGRRARTKHRQPELVSVSVGWSTQRALHLALHWALLACSLIRLIVSTALAAGALPSRTKKSSAGVGPIKERGHAATAEHKTHTSASGGGMSSQGEGQGLASKAPVLSFRLWACISNLVELDARMPWLGGALSLLHLGVTSGPGRGAGLDGSVDRLLSHAIREYVLDPSSLPTIVRAARAALFPNNAPNTASGLTPPASDAEYRSLRRRCAVSLAAMLPGSVRKVCFGGGLWACTSSTSAGATESGGGDTSATCLFREQRPRPGSALGTDQDRVFREIETSVLDVFGDAYCNKHLMYSMLELVLVRLMPELGEKAVSELWDERLG